MRLSATGAVAWVARGEDIHGGLTGFRVRAWTRGAGAVLVDAAPGIDGTSLSLDGSVVRWMRDGAPQAADLTAA